ncbi:MAG: hypothetical protein BWK80_52790 [Desulfobacteraceae bacterium IS3]|nr:MAG: hypothetical protein BWK80_52790 [Desulfobacteraceae bacterium IS3]
MNNNEVKTENNYSNPYIAGVLLGLTLLASFLILGAGLGASGGLARIAAFCEGIILPAHTLSGEYFGSWGPQPLRYYLVYMLVGVFFGGLFSAVLNQRAEIRVEKGSAASSRIRLIFALCGGILVGFASRLAGGCTSGQALSGGAMLLSGSLVFLIFVFIGGYAAAYFVRRQWDD